MKLSEMLKEIEFIQSTKEINKNENFINGIIYIPKEVYQSRIILGTLIDKHDYKHYITFDSLIEKVEQLENKLEQAEKEKQEPHFFDFDYDLLEKLYDKGIYLCNYLENANNRYCEYELGCNGFSKSLLTYKETFLKWSAHKDNKQLTKEEIEELVNE